MKVDRISKDVRAGLAVLTSGRYTWVLGEPDEAGSGLREVYLDGKEEGKGTLLGTVSPFSAGYITRSPDIEVGRQLGIEFPDRPKEGSVIISTTITAIIIMAKKEVVVA